MSTSLQTQGSYHITVETLYKGCLGPGIFVFFVLNKEVSSSFRLRIQMYTEVIRKLLFGAKKLVLYNIELFCIVSLIQSVLYWRFHCCTTRRYQCFKIMLISSCHNQGSFSVSLLAILSPFQSLPKTCQLHH